MKTFIDDHKKTVDVAAEKQSTMEIVSTYLKCLANWTSTILRKKLFIVSITNFYHWREECSMRNIVTQYLEGKK